MTESAQRDIDEPRPQPRELLRGETAIAQRPRPIPLREHVGLAHQPAQGLEIIGLPQIEPRRQFAVAGIVFLIVARRDVRRGDLQNVGAVLGERTGACRTGQHAGQVEDADARQGPVALRQFLHRSLANLEDLHQWQ